MAQTYTIPVLDCSFALNKCMLGVFNGNGSNRVVRLYRAWAINNQFTAVTGVMTTLELRRLTSASGGTAITPVKRVLSSESFPPQIVVATNPTYTMTDLFRRIIWSNDEPVVSDATLDGLETLVPLCVIWDLGYGDPSVDPLTCPMGFGVGLINTGNTSVGFVDIFFEVTLSTS